MKKLSIAIVATIIVEIAMFIIVGNWIGVFPTLLLIIASSLFGFYSMKKNGIHSVQTIQKNVQQGQAPGVAMIEGFLTFVGALLCAIPGFITSIIGLLMIAPFSKKVFMPAIFYWLRKKMKNSQVVIYQK